LGLKKLPWGTMIIFFGEGPKFLRERSTFFRENELSLGKRLNFLRKHMF
jgi:hypothetical protein